MDYTWYNLFLCFWFYSVCGWVCEVIYAFFVHRRFVNRGFLSGPHCPLYGFGAVGFIVLHDLLKSQHILVTFGAMAVFATVLEYATGWLLERLFQRRYWDYCDTRFNLNGYICLRASLMWGLAAVGVDQFVQPRLIVPAVVYVAMPWRATVAGVLALSLLLDAVLSVRQNVTLGKRLYNLYLLAEQIRLQTFQGRGTADLKRRYDRLVEDFRDAHARVLEAFPRMRSPRYENVMHSIREYQQQYHEHFSRIKERRSAKRHARPKPDADSAGAEQKPI